MFQGSFIHDSWGIPVGMAGGWIQSSAKTLQHIDQRFGLVLNVHAIHIVDIATSSHIQTFLTLKRRYFRSNMIIPGHLPV